MTESGETQKDIKEIKWRLENIDNKTDQRLKRDEGLKEHIADLFRDDEAMCKVFLEIDGETIQSEIADQAGVSPATVSRKIDDLDREGLIRKKEHDGGAIYQKDGICRTLRLDEKVTEDGWDE